MRLLRSPERRARRSDRAPARHPGGALLAIALASAASWALAEVASSAGREASGSGPEERAGEDAAWDDGEEIGLPPLGTPLDGPGAADEPDAPDAARANDASRDEGGTAEAESAGVDSVDLDALGDEVDVETVDLDGFRSLREEITDPKPHDDAAADESPSEIADDGAPFGFELAPPQLAYVGGEVVLFRPEEDDRIAAEPGASLAHGDRLATPENARLEIEVTPRVFVRAAADTTFELESLEPDYLRFRLVAGRLSVDARELPAATTLAIVTAHGELAIEHNGYYRIDASGDTTRVTTRRGGTATLTTRSGALPVQSSRQIEATEAGASSEHETVAPALDAWDRWNYRRTGRQLLASFD